MARVPWSARESIHLGIRKFCKISKQCHSKLKFRNIRERFGTRKNNVGAVVFDIFHSREEENDPQTQIMFLENPGRVYNVLIPTRVAANIALERLQNALN